MGAFRTSIGFVASILPALVWAGDVQPIAAPEKATGSGSSSQDSRDAKLLIVQGQPWRASVKKLGGAPQLTGGSSEMLPSIHWVGNVLYVRDSRVDATSGATEHQLSLSNDGARLNINQTLLSEQALLKSSSTKASTDRRNASPLEILTSLGKGDSLEFTTVDGFTGVSRSIRWFVEQNAGGSIVFNRGARTEGPSGINVVSGAVQGGDFAVLEPPNGWLPLGTTIGQEWRVKHTVKDGDFPSTFDLVASAVRSEPKQTSAGIFQTVRVEVRGWATRQISAVPQQHRVSFTAWIEAATHRLIAFTSDIRGGGRPSQERTELSAITPAR